MISPMESNITLTRHSVFARWLLNGRPRASEGYSERRKASTDDAYIQFDAAITDDSLTGVGDVCISFRMHDHRYSE